MGLNLPISLGKSLNFLSPDFCIHKIGVAAGLSRGGDPRSDEMPIGGSGGGGNTFGTIGVPKHLFVPKTRGWWTFWQRS